jgi:hypothetical protein
MKQERLILITNNSRKLRLTNSPDPGKFYKQLLFCYLIPVMISFIMWSALDKKAMINVYTNKIYPDSTLSISSEATLLSYGFVEIGFRVARLIFFIGVCLVIWRSNRNLRNLRVSVSQPSIKLSDRYIL